MADERGAAERAESTAALEKARAAIAVCFEDAARVASGEEALLAEQYRLHGSGYYEGARDAVDRLEQEIRRRGGIE